jgi:hypothetical protein
MLLNFAAVILCSFVAGFLLGGKLPIIARCLFVTILLIFTFLNMAVIKGWIKG